MVTNTGYDEQINCAGGVNKLNNTEFLKIFLNDVLSIVWIMSNWPFMSLIMSNQEEVGTTYCCIDRKRKVALTFVHLYVTDVDT